MRIATPVFPLSLPTRGVPRSGSGSPSLLLSNFGIMLRGASAPPECKNIHPDPPGFLQHLLCANASPKHLELISLRGKTPAFFFFPPKLEAPTPATSPLAPAFPHRPSLASMREALPQPESLPGRLLAALVPPWPAGPRCDRHRGVRVPCLALRVAAHGSPGSPGSFLHTFANELGPFCPPRSTFGTLVGVSSGRQRSAFRRGDGGRQREL